MTQSSFCSEVEEGGFLSSLDLIQDAYEANLQTSNSTNCYKLHQNFSGFQVLAFNCSNDDTIRFLNGGIDLVSSKDREVFDFIATKVNPLLSINEAAVRLFEGVFVELKELVDQLIYKPLVVTGRSLGGYIAVLFTLWLQHVIDEKEADGIEGTKRPICITFGCPLVGNEALQKAISARPQWKSCFLNVVAKNDPAASFCSSNSLYKPFGTFLFCTEAGGHAVFEDQESVLAVLDAMASTRAANMEIPDYGNHLKSIQKKILYRGVSELGKFNSNSLRAGIALQFGEIAFVLDDNLNDLIRKTEERQKEAKRKHKIKSRISQGKRLNKAKKSMACMEYHMNLGRSKGGGYYDNYKNPGTSREDIKLHQEMVTDRLILNQYWKETVEETNLMPPKEGGKLRKGWLYGGGNSYRRIVEPLDIADYYKRGGRDYLANRSNHYKLLEKWVNEDKKSLNPNERGNKAASLNDDSCFWAYVEEALILLKEVKNEGSNGEKLVEFESYVMSAINKYSLSQDVFLEGSSLMKWWSDYKQHKGSSYASELAEFMNNGRYTSYK